MQCIVYMTLHCVGLTQSGIIQIKHRNVGLKCFYLPKFLLLSLVSAYIYISQGSVETHLPCGGISNDHLIANYLQSVPIKKIENWSIIGIDIDKSKMPSFYGPRHGPDYNQDNCFRRPATNKHGKWSFIVRPAVRTVEDDYTEESRNSERFFQSRFRRWSRNIALRRVQSVNKTELKYVSVVSFVSLPSLHTRF